MCFPYEILFGSPATDETTATLLGADTDSSGLAHLCTMAETLELNKDMTKSCLNKLLFKESCVFTWVMSHQTKRWRATTSI